MSTRYDNTGDPHNDHIFRWFNERYPDEMTECLDHLPSDTHSLFGARGRRIAELEAENERLRALLAATQKALVIKPGKTYVIEAPDYATTEQIERLGKMWREMTCSHVVILADGWRVARERVEGE